GDLPWAPARARITGPASSARRARRLAAPRAAPARSENVAHGDRNSREKSGRHVHLGPKLGAGRVGQRPTSLSAHGCSAIRVVVSCRVVISLGVLVTPIGAGAVLKRPIGRPRFRLAHTTSAARSVPARAEAPQLLCSPARPRRSELGGSSIDE